MFLMDFRSLVNNNGLLGFKTYLNLILNEIIDGKQINTLHNLALERLVAYFSTYRHEGDLDFRSGEIYDEIVKLSDKKKIALAKQLKSVLDLDVDVEPKLNYAEFLKMVVVKDD